MAPFNGSRKDVENWIKCFLKVCTYGRWGLARANDVPGERGWGGGCGLCTLPHPSHIWMLVHSVESVDKASGASGKDTIEN